MDCKNEFCIYQLNDRCTLNEVSINHLGMCCSYVQADIKKYILAQAKDDKLRRIEDRKRYMGEL